MTLKAAERPQTIAAWRHMLAGAPPLTPEPAGFTTRRIDVPTAKPVPPHQGGRGRWLIGLLSLPKQMVLVNRAAWDRLDQATRTEIMNKATRAQLASWSESEAQTRSALETLTRNGVKVRRPSPGLDHEFYELGRKLLDEWLATAGSDGRQVVDAYRRM